MEKIRDGNDVDPKMSNKKGRGKRYNIFTSRGEG